MSSSPDHLYLDLSIVNNDTTGEKQIPLNFRETRTNPILDNPSNYFMSVARFSVDTAGYTLPIFMPKLLLDGKNTNINTTAYSVSGTTLTFTEAPASGDAIEVRQITATTTVTSITNGTGNSITVDNNGIAQFSTIHSLQLPTYTVTEANALTNTSAGQMIYVSNGNGGSPCLAVYNGSNWQQVRFDGVISAA